MTINFETLSFLVIIPFSSGSDVIAQASVELADLVKNYFEH